MKFTKPALSIPDLVQRWRDRGLQIADAAEGAHYLQFIGYYRLSAYALPLQDKLGSASGVIDKPFKAGTTFENILNLYRFDRELRLLFMDAIERIEGAQSMLRTLLQRVVPRDLNPENPADPDVFQASRYRMTFTALSPSAIEANGLARFVLEVTEASGKKKLNLSWTGISGTTVRQTQTLLVDASDISFAFATLDQTGVFVWRDDWIEQFGAPALVIVRAKFPVGSAIQWPELVIRPRISRDPSCIYDPVSFSCRHA